MMASPTLWLSAVHAMRSVAGTLSDARQFVVMQVNPSRSQSVRDSSVRDSGHPANRRLANRRLRAADDGVLKARLDNAYAFRREFEYHT
jgi:hypothetical protein